MLVTDHTSPHCNSYASVDDLRRFASSRGYAIPGDDAECEPLLMQAMDYLAVQHWRGTRSSPGQVLPWPRSGVVVDGVPLGSDNIPRQLIQAQCRLAVEAQQTDLTPGFAGGGGGGEVVAESVSGAVAVQYAEGSGGNAPYFSWFAGLLAGLRSSGGIHFDVMRG